VSCLDYSVTFSSRTTTTYVFRLNNTGNNLTSIRSIELMWYDPVNLIKYEGPTSTQWAGSSDSPWDLGFLPNTANVGAPSSNPLNFYFDEFINMEPYIVVALHNNCLVKGGLAPTPIPTNTSTPTATATPTPTITLIPSRTPRP
jgi:hypothetical protein